MCFVSFGLRVCRAVAGCSVSAFHRSLWARWAIWFLCFAVSLFRCFVVASPLSRLIALLGTLSTTSAHLDPRVFGPHFSCLMSLLVWPSGFTGRAFAWRFDRLLFFFLHSFLFHQPFPTFYERPIFVWARGLRAWANKSCWNCISKRY